jgi:hypothetical protein
VQRAALLSAQLEDFEVRWLQGEVVEFSDYLAAVNVQRRVLATLGLERRQRDAGALLPLRERLLALHAVGAGPAPQGAQTDAPATPAAPEAAA